MTAETLSSETARWKARTESDEELLLSYDTISILRPRMPPLALISSAAIWAPPGVAAPAIDCTSAMTPILIGSLDCENAGDVTPASAASAVVAMRKCLSLKPDLAMNVSPFLLRLCGGLARSPTQAPAQIKRIRPAACGGKSGVRCKNDSAARSLAPRAGRMLQIAADAFIS